MFFFCTDHIGKWPTNEKYCRQMFKMCENKLPYPMNGFINPNPSTSPFVNPVTQISTVSESTTSRPITTTSEIKVKQSKFYQYIRDLHQSETMMNSEYETGHLEL